MNTSPGPWSLDEPHTLGDKRDVRSAPNYQGDTFIVAFVQKTPDARLIAAAPVLLAACRAALIALDVENGHHESCQYCNVWPGCSHGDGCPVPGLQDAVKKAVAAEGATP